MSQATTPAPDATRRQVVEDMAALADERPEYVREQCADNFALFADVVTYRWLDPKPEPWFPVPDHALDWHTRFREGRDSPMILAGRKHTKTTWVCCEILHRLQYVPNYKILYWCNNAENQLPARMGELEEMIDRNLWLDGLHKGNPDNQNNIPRGLKQKDFPNGATLYATAVGAGVEGSHVNEVYGDDPLKEMGDVADTDILHFYRHVIVPMADTADRQTVVGTRKRPKDIYHLIQAETSGLEEYDLPGFQLVEYPTVRELWEAKYDAPDRLADDSLYTTVEAPTLAEIFDLSGDTVSLLWPEARGREFLTRKLAKQGKAAFQREFCMVFTHVEDAIIKRSQVERDPVSIHPDGADWDAPPTRQAAEAFLADYLGAEGFAFDRVAVGLDPAVVEGGDNCAWAVTGQHEGTFYHLATTFINGIHPERMRETTADLYDRYEADVIVAEKNGLEWYMDRHVQFPNRLPIRKHNTSAAKHSWQRGVPAIADAIDQGIWRFFRGADATEDLIDGLCSLRMDDNDHLAGHTPDVVMALYMTTKGLGSGDGGVVDLGDRGASEAEREKREAHDAKEAAVESTLEGTELGDAILGMKRERENYL